MFCFGVANATIKKRRGSLEPEIGANCGAGRKNNKGKVKKGDWCGLFCCCAFSGWALCVCGWSSWRDAQQDYINAHTSTHAVVVDKYTNEIRGGAFFYISTEREAENRMWDTDGTGWISVVMMKIKDIWANCKESAAMKERADQELYYAVVNINRCYHLMINAERQELKGSFEELYHNAVKEFEAKAKMYDAIFLTKTVLVYGREHEGGKVVEITFESRPA